jgi:hypothetical protein
VSVRYVLFRQRSPQASTEPAAIKDLPGVDVIDETAGRAMLIEVTDEGLDRLRDLLQGWSLAEEAAFDSPEAAQKPRPESSG